jgi:hypothetical protein
VGEGHSPAPPQRHRSSLAGDEEEEEEEEEEDDDPGNTADQAMLTDMILPVRLNNGDICHSPVRCNDQFIVAVVVSNLNTNSDHRQPNMDIARNADPSTSGPWLWLGSCRYRDHAAFLAPV